MADLGRLEQGGLLIVNRDSFRRGATSKRSATPPNPLEDGSLSNYRVVEVPMTSLTIQATVPLGVKNRDAERSKNFFALGLISWLFSRPREANARLDQDPLQGRPHPRRQHGSVQRRLPLRRDHRAVRPRLPRSSRRTCRAGEYTNISGNTALAWGSRRRRPNSPSCLSSSAATRSRPLPTSCTSLSKHKHFGVRHRGRPRTRIAAAGMALGARVRRSPRHHHHQWPRAWR